MIVHVERKQISKEKHSFVLELQELQSKKRNSSEEEEKKDVLDAEVKTTVHEIATIPKT